jgi:hypothetical protein
MKQAKEEQARYGQIMITVVVVVSAAAEKEY